MDIGVDNNARESVNDSGLVKSSTNGLHKNEKEEITVVSLATDIPRIYNGDLGPNLTDFESDSGDGRFLSKNDLLKSLSDIDNIVINNSSATLSPENMLMHYINKSAALKTESESPNSGLTCTQNQDGAATIISNHNTIFQKQKTEDHRYVFVVLLIWLYYAKTFLN